jgi:hypothetical protein
MHTLQFRKEKGRPGLFAIELQFGGRPGVYRNPLSSLGLRHAVDARDTDNQTPRGPPAAPHGSCQFPSRLFSPLRPPRGFGPFPRVAPSVATAPGLRSKPFPASLSPSGHLSTDRPSGAILWRAVDVAVAERTATKGRRASAAVETPAVRRVSSAAMEPAAKRMSTAAMVSASPSLASLLLRQGRAACHARPSGPMATAW